jgi:uncharacterized protein YcgL (UPF0745 family)
MLCQIYRSAKKAETYLYTRFEEKLEEVPEELMTTFGRAEEVMTLELDTDRKLARAEAKDVLQSIEEKGYYLQLPPASPVTMPGQKELEEQMAKIDELNEKLPRQS